MMSKKHDTHHSLKSTWPRLATWLGLLLLPAAAAAAEPTLEERLRVLEQRLERVQQENDSLRRELGLDGKSALVAVKPAGKEPALTLNGLVQTQAEFGDKGDSRGPANGYDRFRLRRVRLGAAGRFLEEFDFKVEGEYAGASVTLTDGFLNWSRFSWANVKAGQFKTPYGYEFLAADPKLFTIERTLGSDRLTLNRQVGVQASGDFFEKQLSYAVGAFNSTGANVTANDNDQFLYVARVSGIPWQGRLLGQIAKWTAGVDGFTTKDKALTQPADFGLTANSFTGNREGTGVDSQLSVGRFDLWAEYLRVRFEPLDAKPSAAFAADAWYLQATYFLLPKRLQAVVKYDSFDPNDGKTANETSAWTLGANWFVKGDDLKLQCDYVHTKVPAPTPAQEQLWLRAQVIF